MVATTFEIHSLPDNRILRPIRTLRYRTAAAWWNHLVSLFVLRDYSVMLLFDLFAHFLWKHYQTKDKPIGWISFENWHLVIRTVGGGSHLAVKKAACYDWHSFHIKKKQAAELVTAIHLNALILCSYFFLNPARDAFTKITFRLPKCSFRKPDRHHNYYKWH